MWRKLDPLKCPEFHCPPFVTVSRIHYTKLKSRGGFFSPEAMTLAQTGHASAPRASADACNNLGLWLGPPPKDLWVWLATSASSPFAFATECTSCRRQRFCKPWLITGLLQRLWSNSMLSYAVRSTFLQYKARDMHCVSCSLYVRSMYR